MSYPINLSITGKPSPRTDHPASAGSRRAPMTANKNRNQKSSVFCLGSDLDEKEKSKPNQVNGLVLCTVVSKNTRSLVFEMKLMIL